MKKVFIVCGILLVMTGCKSDKKEIDVKAYKLELVKAESKCTTDSKEVEYYTKGDQKVYLVCMEDMKVKTNDKTTTLKEYLEGVTSIDEGISKFTTNMELASQLKDGGTKIYKKDDFMITACNAITDDKTIRDIYISVGDSEPVSRCK